MILLSTRSSHRLYKLQCSGIHWNEPTVVAKLCGRKRDPYVSGISLQLYSYVSYEKKDQRNRTHKNETNTPYIVNYVVYYVSKLLRGGSASWHKELLRLRAGASVLIVIYYVFSFGFLSRSAHDVSAVREVKLKTLIKESSIECKNVFLDTEWKHKIWPLQLTELDGWDWKAE